MRFWLLLPALILASCAQFPELDGTVPPAAQAAPFPRLLPVDPILASTLPDAEANAALTRSVEARVAALRARAARLQRASVIDAPTRARLERAMSNAPS